MKSSQPSHDDFLGRASAESGMENSMQHTARGVRALTGEQFNALESVGGVRGLIEAVLPGLVYLVMFVVTQNLKTALIGSLGIAAIMVIVRLVQRTPVTMAFSGVFGVAIGLYVAWKSGDAQDFYVWGLLVNAAYMLALLVTVLIRWPGVGVLVEMLKSGFGGAQKSDGSDNSAQEDSAQGSLDSDSSAPNENETFRPEPAIAAAVEASSASQEDVSEPNPLKALFPTDWRSNAILMRSYTLVTWLWIAMFVARLVVQLPLYFLGDGHIFGISAFAALGAARLIMGVPLFALVLWLSWRIIRQSELAADPQE